MNIKRKTVALAVVITILSSLFGTAVVAATTEGTVFDAIWDAILGLEEDVEDLQTQTDLQEQINDLEVEVAELRAVLDFLDDPWIQGPPGQDGLDGVDGAQGPVGPAGPQGEQGLSGILSPDFDSGWVTIPDISSGADIVHIEHNLGTNELFVYMIGKDNFGITHQQDLGGNVWAGHEVGAWWAAGGENVISVWRAAEDDPWGSWREVRVLLWILPES